MLFAENVSQNVEFDVGNLLEIADESDNSEYAPLDDIRSIHSDSDEVVTYPEFEGDVDMVDPVLEVELKFRSKKELKVVVKNFSIANRFEDMNGPRAWEAAGENVGQQFAHSQPTTAARIEQGVALHFLSQPTDSARQTLSKAWNNLITK
ncbi:Hypothetical predicted protein [Olea europaea subsp. europaea]|uniref:Uncharacterized protein n=1 Tax=Olea europaea subsp. europaea TaxID=158383 RepID=A0A8S0S004_OLEEU|nr:Hypothetical predicted protein [Olea europaea subsp. europaea]